MLLFTLFIILSLNISPGFKTSGVFVGNDIRCQVQRGHNVYFKGDTNTLMLAMEESSRINPNKIFKIHHALVDKDLVAVHSHVKQNSTDLGVAVVHIFRFEEDKIVELWDLGQALMKDCPNENGVF